MKKEESVRAMLRAAGADAGSRLMFFTADLTSDAGWSQAVAGCDYVLHVASPLSDSARKTEAEVIAPARDGSLRVLRAARDAKVKRVVLTSTCAAVYYGYPPRAEPFDETNWIEPRSWGHERVREVEGDRRARGMGLREGGGRRARARRHQPCRHLRSGPRPGHVFVDRRW